MCDNKAEKTSNWKRARKPLQCHKMYNETCLLRQTKIAQRPLLGFIAITSIVLLIGGERSAISPTNALLSRLNPRRLVSFALSSRQQNLTAEPVQNKLPRKHLSDQDGSDLHEPPQSDKRRERSTFPPETIITTTRVPIHNEPIDFSMDTDRDDERNGSAILEDLVQQLLLGRARFNLSSPVQASIVNTNANDEAEDVTADPTSLPLVQLLTIADSPQTIEVTSETTTNHSEDVGSKFERLQQDLDDRYIHYDNDGPPDGAKNLSQWHLPSSLSASHNQSGGLLPLIRANQLEKFNLNRTIHMKELLGEDYGHFNQTKSFGTHNYTSSVTTSERSIQARSMSNLQQPNVPQHSKPPYASYNQFQNRADLLRQTTGTTTNPPAPKVATNSSTNSVVSAAQNDANNLQNLSSKNGTIEQTKVPVADATPKYSNANSIKAEINQSLNILHSIGQISSHLATMGSEPSPALNSSLSPSPTKMQTDGSQPAGIIGSSPNQPRPPAAADPIDRRDGMAETDYKTLRNRFAPASQSIDLDPIPGTATDNKNVGLESDSGRDPGRFYLSSNILDQSLLALESSSSPNSSPSNDDTVATQSKRDSNRVLHNDRYFDSITNDEPRGDREKPLDNNSLDNELKLTERNGVVGPGGAINGSATAHEFRGATPPSDYQEPVYPDSNNDSNMYAHWSKHRKTAESLKSQILNSDRANVPKGTHAMLSMQSIGHNGTSEPRGSYRPHQASLTNMTAPISSSASPTEAMKMSALDVTSRKPPQRIGTSNPYYLPATDQPAIYSAPANQLFLLNTHPKNGNANEHSDQGAVDHNLDRVRFGGDLHALAASQAGETMRAQSLYEPNITRIQQASGFRSPTTAEPHIAALQDAPGGSSSHRNTIHLPAPILSSSSNTYLPSHLPSSYLSGAALSSSSTGSSDPKLSSVASANDKHRTTPPSSSVTATTTAMKQTSHGSKPVGSSSGSHDGAPSMTNGFVTMDNGVQVTGTNVSHGSLSVAHHQQQTSTSIAPPNGIGSELSSSNPNSGNSKRVFNLTRVEHISADCSDDLIRAVIIFNGTFKGIIYSSGYVRDPNCLYINGTGKNRYDFSIKLNQCGTLGRQELHTPTGPNDIRRRDQVVWNTLSIQYNPIIEQEWDEHFRVSCEYGSDFWKTVSFSPFNVETNTGSPVVFTVNPPQCQMEILRGHSMVGPRQEAVSGPVTVGDPLTLLIHMKSERAGYDILVKNCIAHNGGQQKMQLIDTNGCVVNERFISPFRGTYNDNDLKHVTLYAYLKAFRFTGSPVLYLECEVHMCQSACPPQMCYWRRLSKRSIGSNETDTIASAPYEDPVEQSQGYQIGSLSATLAGGRLTQHLRSNDTSTGNGRVPGGGRRARQLHTTADNSQRAGASNKVNPNKGSSSTDKHTAKSTGNGDTGSVSEKVSLFQALEVRQEREPDFSTETDPLDPSWGPRNTAALSSANMSEGASQLCYRKVEVYAFMITISAILIAAVSITVGCCLRARSISKRASSTYYGRSNQSSCCASTRSNSLWSIPSANYSSANNNHRCKHMSNLPKCCAPKGNQSKVFSIPISEDCEKHSRRSIVSPDEDFRTPESPSGRNASWDSCHPRDRLISTSIRY